MMKITAHTNSGIAVADSPPTEIRRSRTLPSWMRRDHAAEDGERHDDDEGQQRELAPRPRARRRGPPTRGGRCAGDSPRSPVRKLAIQSQYCDDQRAVGAQLLVERVDRRLVGERARGSAAPTSPGSTWAARKITMLRMNSVIRPRATRLARKRAMAGSPSLRPGLPLRPSAPPA